MAAPRYPQRSSVKVRGESGSTKPSQMSLFSSRPQVEGRAGTGSGTLRATVAPSHGSSQVSQNDVSQSHVTVKSASAGRSS